MCEVQVSSEREYNDMPLSPQGHFDLMREYNRRNDKAISVTLARRHWCPLHFGAKVSALSRGKDPPIAPDHGIRLGVGLLSGGTL